MALVNGGVYAIVNNATGTVLDFTGNDAQNLHGMPILLSLLALHDTEFFPFIVSYGLGLAR
jgi:hypothetical protein